MTAHNGERARATREERNATKCRLFTLPAELRLSIFEFVISNLIHDLHQPLRPHYPRDLATKTRGLGFLRVCRAMREEMLSILITWPRLWINFARTSNIDFLTATHLETMKCWFDTLLPTRKFSNDKLLLWLEFNVFEDEDVYISSVDVILRPATQYSEHEIVLGNVGHVPSEVDEFHLIQDFVDGLNDRDEEGEQRLAIDDVRTLLKILCRIE